MENSELDKLKTFVGDILDVQKTQEADEYKSKAIDHISETKEDMLNRFRKTNTPDVVMLKDHCKSLGILTNNRRDGNTTRMVDQAVQLLFKGYTVIIEDHYETINAMSKVASRKMIVDRLMGRLYTEHKIGFKENVTFSKNPSHTLVSIGDDKYTVKFVNPLEVSQGKY